MNKKSFWILAIIGLVLAFSTASAQMPHNNFLDPIVGQYADNAAGWEGPLKSYAMSIFWLLVTVDFAWVAGQLVISKTDFNGWMAELVKQILFVGFFYALLTYSSVWAGYILQSFRLAGDAASSGVGGTTGLQPSNIFDAGADIAATCIKSVKFDMLHLMDNFAIIISGLLIMIAFALIAALEIVVLVESYIYTYAGVLFLGFGGSHFTKDFAVRYLVGLVAVGAKLFVIQLIVGLAQTMAQQWEADIAVDTALINIELLLKMVGGSVVFLALAKMVPDLVQGMVNGASYSSNRALVSSGVAAGHLGMAIGAAPIAVGAGALSMGLGAMGATGIAAGLGKVADFAGNAVSTGASNAMGHSFDEHRSGFDQYMPSSKSNGQQQQNDAPEMKSSWRPGGQGNDLPPAPGRTHAGTGTGNTISI